jgi:hypothetical protein
MPRNSDINYSKIPPEKLEIIKQGFEKFESEAMQNALNAQSESEFWEQTIIANVAKTQIQRIENTK